MADQKQTPVAGVAQTDSTAKAAPIDTASIIAEGQRTIPGTDPAGKRVSPQLDSEPAGEINGVLNEHPAGLPEVPRQFDNGVRATLPEGAEIGPDSPHDNPMPGTNQVNPSAEAVVAAGGALDPTVRQQPLSAGG